MKKRSAAFKASHAKTLVDGLKHRTSFNPASASYIYEKVGIPPALTRDIVNTLRANGWGICSNQEGYWIARDVDDVRSTLAHMKSRIAKTLQAIRGLESTLGAMTMQQPSAGKPISDIKF